ncbi:MAG: glycosyltransferase [Ferruginibacter sp.]
MMIILLVSILLFLIYAVLIIYYRTGWQSIPDYTTTLSKPLSTKISVIIPARNEANNISACIQSILAQSYSPDLFEIIVVDDHSTDNTFAIVSAFTQPNIKIILLSEYVDGRLNAYKKKAIEVAIAQSSGTLIVTTDADCIVQENWLKTIASFYEEHNAAFIAAPVLIDYGNSFIEIFQALDFMTLQGITGASVHKKIHSMCNGANLAYERKVFYEVNGFDGIDSIASGDDMLLMHKIYQRHPENVFYLKSKDAIVKTAPVKTVAAFFNQRIRWASKADKYDDKRILPVLIAVYLFNLFLLLFPIACIFFNIQFLILNSQFSGIQIWICILFLKTIIELIFLFPVASFFGRRSLLLFFPLMQPFHIVYTVIAGFLGKFGSYQWKGRKVK